MSDASTTVPRPVRSRSRSAASTPIVANEPVPASAMAIPARIGPDSSVPVTLMRPDIAWTVWSNPGRSRPDAVFPKPLIET